MNSSPVTEPPENNPVIALPAACEPGARLDVSDAARAREFVASALRDTGWRPVPVDITAPLLSSFEGTAALLASTGADCVFNLFEGFGEDSEAECAFRAIVEDMGIPCTGNPSSVLEICLSKDRCSRMLRSSGIPVPEGVFLRAGEDRSEVYRMRRPLFIKPAAEDASVGIDGSSLVTDGDDVDAILSEKLARFPRGVVVERFLSGKEYSVACLGNGPYEILGVSVIDFHLWGPGLPYLDYRSKWDSGCSRYAMTPQRAEGPAAGRAARLAAAAGQALGCRGYFRVDLREDGEELFVLDVNPNPDMTPDGGFMRQCREKGLPGREAVSRIVQLAMEERRM